MDQSMDDPVVNGVEPLTVDVALPYYGDVDLMKLAVR